MHVRECATCSTGRLFTAIPVSSTITDTHLSHEYRATAHAERLMPKYTTRQHIRIRRTEGHTYSREPCDRRPRYDLHSKNVFRSDGLPLKTLGCVISSTRIRLTFNIASCLQCSFFSLCFYSPERAMNRVPSVTYLYFRYFFSCISFSHSECCRKSSTRQRCVLKIVN